jgi:hypothetical protein
MRESLRAVCMLFVIVGVIGSIVVWIMDRPDQMVWFFRVATPIGVVAAIVAIKLLNQPPQADEAPDYLSGVVTSFFDRGGFCFGFGLSVVKGVCVVTAFYQNQYEGPCRGRIALRPTKGFFLTRPKFAEIRFEVECEPAAFGLARLAVPLPAKLQGKKQAFEVGASADYPEGRGRRLRFREGLLLRANSNFGNTFGTVLAVAGAAGGMIVLNNPATVTFPMPVGVAEDIPFETEPEVKTLWKLGDPLLSSKS